MSNVPDLSNATLAELEAIIERDPWWQVRRMRQQADEWDRKVYFARRPDGAIKIGCSTYPEGRIAILKTAIPLRLLGSCPGNVVVEKTLHYRFRRWRLDGEWFQPAPTLLAYIEATCAVVFSQVLPLEEFSALIGNILEFDPGEVAESVSKEEGLEVVRFGRRLMADYEAALGFPEGIPDDES